MSFLQESAQTHFRTLGLTKTDWECKPRSSGYVWCSSAAYPGLDWDTLDSNKRSAAIKLGFDKKSYNAPTASLASASFSLIHLDPVDMFYRLIYEIVENDVISVDVRVLWSDILSYEANALRGLGWNEDLWNDKSKYPNIRLADWSDLTAEVSTRLDNIYCEVLSAHN